MRHKTLSAYVRHCPRAVDSSLECLKCVSQGITDVDIHPTVLAVLTNSNKHAVPVAVRASAEQRAGSCGAGGDATATHPAGAQVEEASRGFNTAIAFSLHTVLLSRNSLRDITGIIQFKNVVRLSLLGNRIDTIESCEPLSLLSQLEYLSLEFNPVTTLPHYRAHILRICSWPQPLSPRHCRLKKLDGIPTTKHMIERSVRCLLREASLLPELSHRIRLVCFLGHVARQQRLVAEMQRRGFLFKSELHSPPVGQQDAGKKATCLQTLQALFSRCGETAVRALDAPNAAHLCRILARDHQRLTRRGRHRARPRVDADDSDVDDSVERGQLSSIASLLLSNMASDDTEDEDTFAGNHGSGQNDDVSDVLASVSDILLTNTLSTPSSNSLRNASAAVETTVCDEWSMDWFRVTISSVDVHLCRLLLRVARAFGGSLDSNDVDRLLRQWLRLLVETNETTLADIDVTGNRRDVFVTSTPQRAMTRAGSASRENTPSRAASAAPTANTSVLSSITADTVGGTVVGDGFAEDGVTPTRDQRTERSVGTTPSTLILDLDNDTTASEMPDDSASVLTTWTGEGAEDVARELLGTAAPTAAPSTASASSGPTETEPRVRTPVAAPPTHVLTIGRPPLVPAPLPDLCSPCVVAESTGRAADGYSAGEDDPLLLLASQFQLFRWKERVWRQWRHKQSIASLQRQCDEFIRARAADTFKVGPGSPLLHSILPRMPYTERKRCFFDHWRMRYEATQVERLFRMQSRFGQWRRRALERNAIRQADAWKRATQLRASFVAWKKQVVSRRLLLSASPMCPSRQLNRPLAVPFSEAGLPLCERTVDSPSNVTELDKALRGCADAKGDQWASSPTQCVVKHVMSPDCLVTSESNAMDADTDVHGLSPSHPMTDGLRSPYPYMPSPVVALHHYTSYDASPMPRKPSQTTPLRVWTDRTSTSPCRYAAAGSASPNVRVSLPQNRPPTLRPPPPLMPEANSDGSSRRALPCTTSSALRWSDAGLARSVSPPQHRSARTGPILAPIHIATIAEHVHGGPYPQKDVEALVAKAGLLHKERDALTVALQKASDGLQHAQRDCAASSGKVKGVELALHYAHSEVASLQRRVDVLTSEMEMLQGLITTLRRGRRAWLQNEEPPQSTSLNEEAPTAVA